tara:strand:+ start:313 stop:1089 length:777 start_codon:yes stop_codon:yes gene_type:complete
MESFLKKIESIPGTFSLEGILSSSLTSYVYLCTFNETKAVIRFDLPAASRLAVDRQNEATLLKNISHLDLSPDLIYLDESAQMMILKYISGTKPVFDQNKPNIFSLIDLGKSLALIHSSSISKNFKNIFSDSMILYRSLLGRAPNKDLFSNASNLYNELIDDGVKMVLSHNDLHPGNIIWNSKYYFLDWEFSSSNHPCFDIASLVRSFNLNESQIYDLSKGYEINRKIFNMNKLEKWIIFLDLLDQIWEIALTKISKN